LLSLPQFIDTSTIRKIYLSLSDNLLYLGHFTGMLNKYFDNIFIFVK